MRVMRGNIFLTFKMSVIATFRSNGTISRMLSSRHTKVISTADQVMELF